MTPGDANVDADERLRRRLAAAVALLLNLGFFVALDQVMRPLARERTPWARVEPADVLQVRLIDAPPPSVPPEPAATPASEPAPAAARTEAPAERPRRIRSAGRSTSTAPPVVRREPEPAAAPPPARTDSTTAPQFYDRAGQVRLPESKTADAEAPFPRLPIVPTEGNPFVHANPVPYEPTRFDKYFPDVRETLGGELVRKATVKRSGRLPWGTYVECTWVLFFGGCGWGSPPTATIEELKAMRADPPLPKSPQPPASDASAQ